MRFSRYVPFLVASALSLQSGLACAGDPNDEEELALIYGDKTSVSIATGSAQSLRRAPAVATVITAEDIAIMRATDLDQVLETVPGLHVSRAAIDYEPLYTMRGIYSASNPQILMLLNGMPMTTLLTGSRGTAWAGYPVEHIARIEVIRGPGSALYGADAYSGVINIITKGPANATGTHIGVGGGSFKTRDAWVQHTGKLGPLDLAAYLRIGDTDGQRSVITADAQTARDKIFGTHASLAPGPVNTGYESRDANLELSYDKWRLRGGYVLRDNIGTGAGVASALDPVGKLKSERTSLDLSWTAPLFTSDWGVGFDVSAMEYKQRIPEHLRLSPPGTRFPTGLFPDGFIGHPDTSERQIRTSVFATYNGFESHKLRFGAGHDNLNMYHVATIKNYLFNAAGVPVPAGPVADYSTIQPFLLPHRRKISYYNIQDEVQLARDWALTAGVRHDRYSDFGTTTNPRMALVWDAALDVTAKLLYGRAFRAPSFNESYGINNPVQRGNPDLRPETIGTLEAAVSWQVRKDMQVNVNLFRTRLNDLIRAVANANGATFQNIGNQNGKGGELEVAWDASRTLRISGNYGYQRSTDPATGKDTGYAPHQHLNGRLDWQAHGYGVVSAQINHVADRRRAAGDPRPKVPDYTTFDLSLSTDRGLGNWDISIALRNLFNADVREPSLAPGTAIPNDLPMAPRSIYLRATYQL
ncbi:TonB-dependent receptor plug domain-containing protein [Pseudoduganella rivuli]|nr:TonB-dependent receptor [Pseudoduganella rivuli]